jgi:hypothetical protein
MKMLTDTSAAHPLTVDVSAVCTPLAEQPPSSSTGERKLINRSHRGGWLPK